MKKFKEFTPITESIMPHDIKEWEHAATYIKNDRRRGLYIDALKQLYDGYNKKEIYQARFGELYSYGLARGLEDAWQELRFRGDVLQKMRDYNEKHGHWPNDSLFAINSIAKLIREWKAMEHEFPEIYQFVYSLRNLPTFIKELKGYLKKGREPKPVDPNAFVKPMVPLAAKKQAIKFLDEAVAQIRDRYYEDMIKRYMVYLDMLIADAKTGSFTWSAFQNKYRAMNLSILFLGQKVLEPANKSYRPDTPYVIKSNAVETTKDEAIKLVDEIIAGFLAKNSEKLGLIFQKKADIAEHRIVKNKIHDGVLENEMFFKFSDNSSFTMYTTTVYGYSKLNTFFVRFPTRFTDVKMADGSKMGMPSEEKMIKEF